MTGKDITATIDVPLIKAIPIPKKNKTNPAVVSNEPAT